MLCGAQRDSDWEAKVVGVKQICGRLIKAEVIDVVSPHDAACHAPGKCLQQELYKVSRRGRPKKNKIIKKRKEKKKHVRRSKTRPFHHHHCATTRYPPVLLVEILSQYF